MPYPDEFEGFMIDELGEHTKFKRRTFKPKVFGDHDVDIQIECCGVCGSDVHTVTGGWGDAPTPLCVGHEIIGKAVKVGSKVADVRPGDRVGVGAQIWSCLRCQQCEGDNENYCPKMVDTYGAPYPPEADPHGTVSQGGYSSHIRAHEYFVFPIPDAIPSHMAAPMLCAGLTVWSPLVRAGIGPGKKVAVAGLGGLGHFAVLWAAALGAEVTVLSHSPRKEADARQLGAAQFVSTAAEGWAGPLAFAFDLVLNTADATDRFAIGDYLSVLKVGCQFHQVGLPDKALPRLKPQMFMANGSSIGASHIGSRPECLAMLRLAAEKKLTPRVETLPVSEKGCAEAIERVVKGDVRYRFTLVDYDKAFKV
ncbi:NADPH-dependent medium chain alcohol dehydrogenase [Durotheca rogersii]|uniref:NADPH-dependent medium chain alcohol dehydrogenase n=1 Tax=Durotheca rogersii TaxID=419775 RepID=UPI00221FABBB|nr:NADPH-dependent medium chain alcohol dehydrogenase [Durotheca rogersii]KAI5863850.1 NADPH-dependent medium chain alcohol dehydrogenase [Durotheca rogersii]